MDNRAIGVFDSGLGGLTAVKELISLMPKENIVYFGDTGRVPYGTRSSETIKKYAAQDIRFLQELDIKAIVVACGTVSTVALPLIKNNYDIPIVGVVEPSVRCALKATRNKKIGIIATPATIASHSYEDLIHDICPDAQTFSKACPLFVPVIEDGRFNRGDKIAASLVEEYLAPLKAQEIDTLILGCTHYPLLTEIISDYLGDGVSLINSGRAVAESIHGLLTEKELLCDNNDGLHRYYLSDSGLNFKKFASMFMGREISESVKQIDIERY